MPRCRAPCTSGLPVWARCTRPADNVVAVLTGRPPRAIVNPEVLGARTP